jgi:hypothetical protein
LNKYQQSESTPCPSHFWNYYVLNPFLAINKQ